MEKSDKQKCVNAQFSINEAREQLKGMKQAGTKYMLVSSVIKLLNRIEGEL